MKSISRRDALRALGTVAAAPIAMAFPGRFPTPALAQGSILTVSIWGGVSQEAVKSSMEAEFGKLTGAKLAFDIGGQGARYNKLLAQRANPPADVFYCSDEAVVSGLRAGILTPVARKQVPNLVDVSPAIKQPKSDGADTVAGVPAVVLAYELAYNVDTVKEPVTSWNDLWRPEFKGKLAFPAPVHSQMPAMVIIAAELAGGSIDNIDPGFKKLAELRPSKLTVFWTDWAPLFKSGDVVMSPDFDYYMETAKAQGYRLATVAPKEKAIGTPNYATIVKGTKNQELAEAFLNLVLDPRVQTQVAVETFQGPTNVKAVLPSDVAAKTAYGPKLEKMRFFDPEFAGRVRPMWTERLNIEVVPSWGAR